MTINDSGPAAMNFSLPQLRLLQLASPSLPVGSYAYSQGLEMGVEKGWVSDIATLEQWLKGMLGSTLTKVDIPLLIRLHMAWQLEDLYSVEYWNDYLLASRETMELRNEERVRGMALWNLLLGTAVIDRQTFDSIGNNNIGYLCAYACAVQHWNINLHDAMLAYVWSWAENQVLAAIKLMPVGQLAGQTLLGNLLSKISSAVTEGMKVQDDEIGALLPACTMASVMHETQYSRLFRS